MMRVKRNKLIVVVIGFLVLLEVTSIFLMWKSSMNKPTILDNVKLQNIKNDGNLAIMIEQEDGSYKETSGNSWPEDMMFNEEKSGCVDNNGQLIENALVYEDGIATVETGVTSNCYLYFDLIKDDIIISLSTDGETGVMPISGVYTNSATCNSGSISWSDKYQRIEIGDFSSKQTKCNVTFTKDTSTKTLLIDEVVSKATEVSLTNKNNKTETSYRYQGKQPDNWVWFNNEKWRIIGSIPVCLDSTCSTKENLIKIIRAETIGSTAYGNGGWGTNTLSVLLNDYYYGKQDGTGTTYCYGYRSSVSLCNYTRIGIAPDGYYGKMIRDVYWNIGAISSETETINNTYKLETATLSGDKYKIGIMNGSDYGYAYNNAAGGLSISQLGSYEDKNWFMQYYSEFTLIPYSNGSMLNIAADGTLGVGTSNSFSYAIRPVVYLDSGVFIIDGNGSITNPYIIGM